MDARPEAVTLTAPVVRVAVPNISVEAIPIVFIKEVPADITEVPNANVEAKPVVVTLTAPVVRVAVPNVNVDANPSEIIL